MSPTVNQRSFVYGDGWPNATNTGVPSGTSLTTVTGLQYITTPGTVYEDKLVEGTLVVTAPNVTIRRCHIQPPTGEGVYNVGEAAATGLLIEDCRIELLDPAGSTCIAGHSYTARRCNMTGGHNATAPEHDVVLEDNYIWDIIPYDPELDPHTDCVQLQAGADNVTINHNTMFGDFRWPNTADGGPGPNTGFGNSSITVGAVSDVTITNNKIGGGGTVLQMQQATGSTNLVITGNRWSQETEVAAGWPTFTAGAKSGQPIYGGFASTDGFDENATVWSDNKYLDGPLAGTNVI
jgi:hypothetical protein